MKDHRTCNKLTIRCTSKEFAKKLYDEALKNNLLEYISPTPHDLPDSFPMSGLSDDEDGLDSLFQDANEMDVKSREPIITKRCWRKEHWGCCEDISNCSAVLIGSSLYLDFETDASTTEFVKLIQMGIISYEYIYSIPCVGLQGTEKYRSTDS